MGFDFDTCVERRGTASSKWDKYRGRDVVPMWVADMDFRSPPAVIEALQARVAHGVFGYTLVPQATVEAVLRMCAERHQWEVEPEWLVWFPGLGSALNAACRAAGSEGDEVLINPPIYPPFLLAPQRSRRRAALAPLACTHGHWEIDFARLSEAVSPRTRLYLFCNPHNPVGRVFSRAELERVAEFCLRHDLVLCSDEIHCDLILDPERVHVPVARLAPEIAARSITLMAPSKTYNLAGLQCAFAVVPDAGLRRQLRAVMAGIVPSFLNALGFAAAEAAYTRCEDWRQALIDYLRANRGCVMRELARMPGLAAGAVQSTYLAWVDARELALEDPAGFFEGAGVGLSDGREFGSPGYVRLNFGCPRAQLDEALQRMARALDTRLAGAPT